MNFEIINRHGEKIVGVAEEVGKNKLAIVMHGLSGHIEEPHVQEMRKSYLASNYSVIAFDCTHSFGKSGGDYETVTLTSYLEDLEDVIKWAKKQDWYPGKMSLAGHSMGGYAILRYAELHLEDIENLIAFAPVVSGKSLEETRRKHDPSSYKKWQETGELVEESISRPGLMKRLKWNPHVTDSYSHDLMPYAKRITAPLLIIVGENDWPCPVPLQQQLFDSLASKDKTLHIVPDAPHTFTSAKDLKNLRDTIQEWLLLHKDTE